MTYIKILPQNTNFCVKKHKFKMTWLEKYMYCLFERRRREQIFLICSLVDKLLTYQIFKGKKV